MLNRSRIAPLLVALLAASSCTDQPTTSATPPQVPDSAAMKPAEFHTQAAGYTLSGQLTDARTGAPITGGVITVYGSTVKGSTDGWGYYYMSGLPSGSRAAYFVGPGFTGQQQIVTISSTTAVTANASLNFTTAGYGTVTGKITNAATGAAIPGATVYINKQTGKTTTTAADGTYSLTGVVAGAEQVVTTPNGYSLWPNNVDNVIVYNGGTTTANIALQPSTGASPTPTPVPTASASATPTPVPTATASATPKPSPTATATPAPTPTPTPVPTSTPGGGGAFSQYGAPDTGMYVGWFGKPCTVNGGGFSEVFSGGSNTDGNTANKATTINATLDWVANRYGRPFSLFHIYEGAGGKADFPVTTATEVAKRHQILMVSLSMGSLTAQQMAGGSADAMWKNWAQGAKSFGKPVILRWGWEAPIQPWAQNATYYKQAWQRLWKIVKQDVGATNVKMAYTPVYFSTGYGTYKDYFPGDQYVDWVGVDDYQPPSTTYAGSFKTAYDYFQTVSPNKPFIVGEWGMKYASDNGSTTYSVPAYPNDWYSNTLEAAKTYKNLKAYVLYDNDQEIKSALGPNWAGLANLKKKLLDTFYLQQSPLL